MIMRECFLWGEPFGHSGLVDSLADPIRCFNDRWPEAHHFHRGEQAEALSQRFIANLYPLVDDLLRAQQSYFLRLLAEPARRHGARRWGMKEVRLDCDHAIYLQWLFPRAKFVLLIRNPYDAYRSYAARAARGWSWYHRWPGEPVTVGSFARHWRRLVTSFIENHHRINALVVRYEDLSRGRDSEVEEYLGFPLSKDAGRTNPGDGGPPPLQELLAADRMVLENELGPLASSLGYTSDDDPDRRRRPSDGLTVREDGDPSGERPSPPAGRLGSAIVASAGSSRKVSGPDACVILVPVGHHIEPSCDASLRELERRGYTVRRVHGYSAVDQARNQMATDALRDGFQELFWIDADIVFSPEAVDRLRSHGQPFICGIYAKKGENQRSFACKFPRGTSVVGFGKAGGLIDLSFAGTGFLLTHRAVYQTIQERLNLPVCNERFGPSMIPFFQPTVIPDDQGSWYLGEDYSFSHRARECGYKIMADTTIRLRHVGSYAFGWEDPGSERTRYDSYTFHISE